MHGLSNRCVVHLQVTPDGADNHLSGVQTHSYLYGNSLGPSYSLSVAFHRLLHPERRIASTYRMVLVRQGCSEQRHDPIAHHLVDCSFVTVDGLHHMFKDWVEDLSRLLRITIS